MQQVEQLIGSNKIAGTSALDGTRTVGRLCGIVLRLEPAACDLVQIQRPTVTVLSRAGGNTTLRIEEDIVVRTIDESAIHLIAY